MLISSLREQKTHSNMNGPCQSTTTFFLAMSESHEHLLDVCVQNLVVLFKGTNPALKKPSNIPEIYAKMFGRFH